MARQKFKTVGKGFETTICVHCKQQVTRRASLAVGEFQRGKKMPRAHRDRSLCNQNTN